MNCLGDICKAKNMEYLKSENCPEITNIYASLSHLKSLIKDCPKFQERDLLLTHEYNF